MPSVRGSDDLLSVVTKALFSRLMLGVGFAQCSFELARKGKLPRVSVFGVFDADDALHPVEHIALFCAQE